MFFVSSAKILDRGPAALYAQIIVISGVPLQGKNC